MRVEGLCGGTCVAQARKEIGRTLVQPKNRHTMGGKGDEEENVGGVTGNILKFKKIKQN